jgi:hypothetical protein
MVETRRRLVEHEDLWAERQDGGDARRCRTPLSRRNGSASRSAGPTRGERFRDRASTSAGGSPRFAGPNATSSAIVSREELVIRILEDVADLLREVLERELATERPWSRTRRSSARGAVQVLHERRLPGAVLADDRDELARADRERHVRQRLRPLA